MTPRQCRYGHGLWGALLALLLAACGGGGQDATPAAPALALSSDIAVDESQPGPTPFIAFVRLKGSGLDGLASVRYTIEARPGAATRPVDVSYDVAAVRRRGYVSAATGRLTVPVFGLYANRPNAVSIELRFSDGSTRALAQGLPAVPYVDATATYDRPTFIQARAGGSRLGFDYILLKSRIGPPIVVDTDGEVRWLGIGVNDATSVAFVDNGFVVGDPSSVRFSRLELDGALGEASVLAPTYTRFHHNIDPGKEGLIGEFDRAVGGVTHLESVAAEFSSAGAVIREWDFATILGDYMRAQGDDPSAFIRPGADWFHMNAATYDARDDTLIASSRENFVIKVDYRTGEIRWVFGDPTKYWYTFPSLRAKALTLDAGGLYPIGQHGLSITPDGLLLMFNDGLGSIQQPAGAPAGESRSYSAVTAYTIDPAARTARQAWRYDHEPAILSDICSSAYQAADGSVLIAYSAAVNRTAVRMVGLDAAHQVVFEWRYAAAAPCTPAWNAVPVPFEAMAFR